MSQSGHFGQSAALFEIALDYFYLVGVAGKSCQTDSDAASTHYEHLAYALVYLAAYFKQFVDMVARGGEI